MESTPPRPGINWNKIVENVISYLVTAVFVGACAIVWRGATTVDERVGKTEKNFTVLIENLSAKLSAYEVQLEHQSNQLSVVCVELKNLKPIVADAVKPKPALPALNAEDVQQMRQQNIQRELLKK